MNSAGNEKKPEYIERSALLEEAKKRAKAFSSVLIYEAIKEAPAVDVEEVKYGEWLYFECVASHDGAISGYGCSVCSAFVDENVFDTDEFHKKRCGNCGAKMDGKKGEG